MPRPPPRYLLRVEYDGAAYAGWQRQRNAHSVQAALEEALRLFSGAPVAVDAGVHALGQACHVDLARTSPRRPGEQLPPFSADTLRSAANHFLARAGEACRVLAARRVSPACHARFSACQRTYHYRIHAAPTPPALALRAAVWHLQLSRAAPPLDVAAMRLAAASLLGRHDFSAFRASGCGASGALRTLSRLDVAAAPAWHVHPAQPPWLPRGAAADVLSQTLSPPPDGAHVVVTAAAPSFLYHQVRLLVGTLAAVGAGKLPPEAVPQLLRGRDTTRCPGMAPAHGLYLADVAYSPEALELTEDEEHGRHDE